jgi:hypothetical protein
LKGKTGKSWIKEKENENELDKSRMEGFSEF